jgi:hypothetical protein
VNVTREGIPCRQNPKKKPEMARPVGFSIAYPESIAYSVSALNDAFGHSMLRV